MRLAVMQPYLFPYLGYFQLIAAVDTFVVYDDVNYIKGGWINRNNILLQDRAQRVTLDLDAASPNKRINEIAIHGGQEKLLKTIGQCYAKAPQFASVFPLLETILKQPEKNLARFLDGQLRQICDYLGLRPQWLVSSSLEKDNTLHGQEKILAICETLGATHYINPPGGKSLYDRAAFALRGARLSFIRPRPITYRQFGKNFVPDLSVIDVMMFNDREQCARLLGEYDLV
jgi:hypothetical protein